MRLEVGTFPVTQIAFGSPTRYELGRLTVDRDAVLAAVREDARIASAELEIARPGESVRIWPVRDVIEPRVKVQGPGVCYPGICGRDITTVGEGRTRVRVVGAGYPDTEVGRQLVGFFREGNRISLERLRERFVSGPVDWSRLQRSATAQEDRP